MKHYQGIMSLLFPVRRSLKNSAVKHAQPVYEFVNTAADNVSVVDVSKNPAYGMT